MGEYRMIEKSEQSSDSDSLNNQSVRYDNFPNSSNDFHPDLIRSTKKSIWNNKILIFTISTIAVLFAVLAAFAYNEYWVVDRAPVLVNYAKTDDVAERTRKNILEGITVNVSLSSDVYDLRDEQGRQQTIELSLDKYNNYFKEYKSAVSEFNANRDPKFYALANNYSEYTDACMAYATSANSDISKLGSALEGTRIANNELQSLLDESASNSPEDKIAKLKLAHESYVDSADKIEEISLATEDVKSIATDYGKLINSRIISLNPAKLSAENLTTSFIKSSTIAKTEDIDRSSQSIAAQFASGVCWSQADDDLAELLGEYNFNENDKSILDTLEAVE